MATINIQVPDSILNALQSLAMRENVTIDQLAASALSEKVAALMGDDYFAARAARGSREKFEQILANVPDVPPIPPDEPVE